MTRSIDIEQRQPTERDVLLGYTPEELVRVIEMLKRELSSERAQRENAQSEVKEIANPGVAAGGTVTGRATFVPDVLAEGDINRAEALSAPVSIAYGTIELADAAHIGQIAIATILASTVSGTSAITQEMSARATSLNEELLAEIDARVARAVRGALTAPTEHGA